MSDMSDTSETLTKGHRARLRQRFLEAGLEGLAEHELLELILFNALPRIDTKPLAKKLLQRFGSFAAVVSATPDELASVSGIGITAISALKLIQAGALSLAKSHVMHKPILSSWTALIDYCHIAMSYEKIEQTRILLLDHKNRLLADEIMHHGTLDHTAIYPREVAKRALYRHATALILVHNHPSGDPTPSKEDIIMTRKLKDALDPIGIILHDHLVIAGESYVSFKSLGLL